MKVQGTSTFTYDVYSPTNVTTMLRARRQQGQSIIQEGFEINPSIEFSEYTDVYGNSCQRFVLPVGKVTISTQVQAQVEITKPIPDPVPAYILVGNLPDDVMIYVLPSRYCQSDMAELSQLAWQIAGNFVPGYDQVEEIRKWVHANVHYQYGITSPTTTALDIAQGRIGVCRDFTHLAIALCRSLNIPARMTVGYLDQLQEMDLHAWFEVYIGGEWYAFDAVQAQTGGYRIEIAHGRDAADVAMVTQFGNATLQSLHVQVELLDQTGGDV
jgi:transglutaminase-like putative cysteine protease